MRKVLTLLQKEMDILKLKKYRFLTITIDYLGQVIQPRRLEIALNSTDAIRQLKEPLNVTEYCSFSCLCSIFRQFVHTFAQILASLNRKRQKNRPNEFRPLSDEERVAMKTPQERLISSPDLTLPYTGGQYTINTDARNVRVGCLLLREQTEKTMKPSQY